MKKLRYPAVPLITVDPYFSVWSFSDLLYDDTTKHWTGRTHGILGLITIDEEVYRFMGKTGDKDNFSVITQTDVTVYPLSTVYTFENEIIRLTLKFMTPLLCDDLHLLSRPVSYIDYKIEVLDGKNHTFELFFGLNCEMTVNSENEKVSAKTYENGVFCGRGDVDVLKPTGYKGDVKLGGDNLCINYGYLHLYSNCDFIPHIIKIDTSSKLKVTKEINVTENVYIALEKDFKTDKHEKGFVCVAYDDIHSIEYFGEHIDAFCKKDGDTFEVICKKALDEYEEICSRVEKFETDLLKTAKKISHEYADIISLAYRQAIGAHKLTYHNGEIQFLSKECFSNGCIGTLDVTYPSIPLFLMLNPTLVEGMLNPLFRFARSSKWEFDFAPHDVGQYPFANGQVYGIDDNGNQLLVHQMPVEESANAIICVYAICHFKNDFSYFEKNKDLLEIWVKYLLKYGLDPENQLCTDDFAGHLAHNCNLSAKAIMGICAYGKLLENSNAADFKFYIDKAKEYAKEWERKSLSNDHYRLAFDKEDSWSIKYNIVWDKLFKWGIFDDDVFEKEVSFYLTQIKEYGLPLDNRSDYTKSDWQMWSVCLTDNKEYQNKIISAMWKMLDETKSRVPFTDWYFCSDALQRGFQNRTVQGGLFMPLL
ncbi:MAG: DUF4965 domain-containing protein [Clostridia bacterium]|nr:DUF4965 domain-containing protein [Clostridia bacterium]